MTELRTSGADEPRHARGPRLRLRSGVERRRALLGAIRSELRAQNRSLEALGVALQPVAAGRAQTAPRILAGVRA